jgi:hypothetical protein
VLLTIATPAHLQLLEVLLAQFDCKSDQHAGSILVADCKRVQLRGQLVELQQQHILQDAGA